MASSEAPERMTTLGERFTIRKTKDAAVFQDAWWSHMLELGWNRSYYDLASYTAATHSEGWNLLYPSTTQERPQGHVLACVNANSTGWIAMFIISETQRGKGFGGPLFASALADITRLKVEYTGLDAVKEQVGTYSRRGFEPGSTLKLMSRSLLQKSTLPEGKGRVPDGLQVKECKDVHFAALVQAEKEVTGFARPQLWTKEYFARPDVEAVALIDPTESETESVLGWTVIRGCPLGARIGPLYAENAKLAEAILTLALEKSTAAFVKRVPQPGTPLGSLDETATVEQATVQLEVYCDNSAALALFESLGFEDAGVDYYRMWLHGKAPSAQSKGGIAEQQVWAVYDAAIG